MAEFISRGSYLEDKQKVDNISSAAPEHHQDNRTVFRSQTISKARYSLSLTKLAQNQQYQAKKRKKKGCKNIHHRV